MGRIPGHTLDGGEKTMTERSTTRSSGEDMKQFLLALDDDMSKWPDWRKRPESSPLKHKDTDFLPGGKKDQRELAKEKKK